MVSWTDAQTLCQTLSSDSTPSSLTTFKLLMNIGYKFCLAEIGKPVTEKTNTSVVTVASQRYYDLPMDCLFLKSISLTIGAQKYPITEEEDQESWDYLTQVDQGGNIPEKFFLRLNYGVGKSEVGIYPTPSTAGYAFTLVHEIIDKDLSADVYATGTLTMTNGDKTVTIATGAFTAAMVNRYIKGGDGYFYRIASRTDTNNAELDHAYEGTTSTSISTEIYDMFKLPEEMQILPVYYALAHFFAIKKDTTQETKYWTLYTAGLEDGKRRWGTKTRSAISRGTGFASRFAPWGPAFWPSTIT